MLVCVSVISVATASHGSEEYSSKYTKETTITSVNLPNEISTVTYTVTIQNYYKDTYALQEIQNVEDSNPDITFQYSNDIVGDDIKPGEELVFDITFKNSTFDNKTKTLILKYIFGENNKTVK